MRILLTGSSGFIGKEISKLLEKRKIVLIKTSRKKLKNHYLCNLENKIEVNNLLKKTRPDVIINLAAKVNFEKSRMSFFRINYILPKVFSNYCKKKDKYLIHTSTISIHGQRKRYNFKSKFSPNSNYAASKLNGDKFIIESNCKYTIIRFPGIYGKNGPKHLFINKFLNKGKSYDVKIKNNGKQFRNYISVKDAARMILHFLKKRRQKIIYTGGEKLSIKSMMYCLKRNNFIKNIYFSRKKQDDQIVESNFKFNHLSFKKNIMLIRNQTK